MLDSLRIERIVSADLRSAYRVFQASIADAFEQEGLGHLQDDIQEEVAQKQRLLDASLNPDSGVLFLIAKLSGVVVGTVSFGPINEDIRKCAGDQLQDVGELGSLYILPEYQNQGIGSALIDALVTHLARNGVERFCLDCGLKRAQQRWLRKFGTPYKVAPNYWESGSDHLVWLCDVADFVK